MFNFLSKLIKPKQYKLFEKTIGYKFASTSLLTTAITHCSVADNVNANYERLEFLGDAVLSCIFAEYFFKKNSDCEEGVLAQNKSIITNGKTLSIVARTIGLEKIIITRGEEIYEQNGDMRKSILEDVLEAVIGAIFLETGFNKTKKIVLPWFGNIDSETEKIKINFNPKGRLQEYLQAKKPIQTIDYVVSKELWMNKKKLFFIDLLIDKQKQSSGKGTSKKEAEENAAQIFLNSLNKLP